MKDRTAFLDTIERMVKEVKNGTAPASKDVVKAMTLLGRSRVPPVVMPVAVARAAVAPVKF